MAKLKKKERAIAAQAKRDAEKKEKEAAVPVGETEDEKKRREDDKKREEEERKVEEKRKDDERLKKKREDEKRLECFNVVPGSAKKLTLARDDVKGRGGGATSPGGPKMPQSPDEVDDDEFVLYRVVVMRKGADSYRNLCRDRRYTVRPFKYDPDDHKSQKDKRRSLELQKANVYRSLVNWCNTTFGELFNAWLHIKAMRVFVEAVLRYGLPDDFSSILLKPKKGFEKKLREALSELYSKLSGDSSLADQLEAGETDLSGMGADFYPYVYLPINLTDHT